MKFEEKKFIKINSTIHCFEKWMFNLQEKNMVQFISARLPFKIIDSDYQFWNWYIYENKRKKIHTQRFLSQFVETKFSTKKTEQIQWFF